MKSERAWDIIARNVNNTKKDVKTRWRNLRDVFLKELKKARKPRSGDPGSPNEQYYSGKWTYYQHMLFLKDVSMPRPTECNSLHQETEYNDNDASLPSTSRSEQNLQLPDEENSTAMSNRSEAFVSSDDEPLSNSARSSITQSTSALSTEALDSGLQTGSQKRKRKENQSLTEYQRRMIQIEEDKIKAFKEKEKEVEDEDLLFLKSLAPYFKYMNPVQKLRLKSKLQNTIADEISLAMPSPPSNSSSTMSMSIIPSPVHASSHPSMTPPTNTQQFYESFNAECDS